MLLIRHLYVQIPFCFRFINLICLTMFILQILLLLFKNKCFLAKKPVMGVLPSFINMQTCHGSFAIFYEYTNLPWEFLPSFMGKQTCREDFCHLLWANKPVIGVFAIFYGHTNLPWEFLPSFMGKQIYQEFLPSFIGIQTYHGSFCHLL